MKVALVAGVKQENTTLREWVEHCLSIGFDHLLLWDNNFKDGEHPEDVLDGLFDRVEIRDIRGQRVQQLKRFNESYRELSGEYDWLAFFDADEWLVLNHDSNVKDYLSRFPENVSCVHVNWKMYGDNGHLHPTGEPTFEQFPEPCPYDTLVQYRWPEDEHVKTIVRTNKDAVFGNPHFCTVRGDVVNNAGDPVANTYRCPVNYDIAELRHYQMRSTEEFCRRRLARGWDQFDGSVHNAPQQIKRYFAQSEWTREKQDLIDSFIKGDWR